MKKFYSFLSFYFLQGELLPIQNKFMKVSHFSFFILIWISCFSSVCLAENEFEGTTQSVEIPIETKESMESLAVQLDQSLQSLNDESAHQPALFEVMVEDWFKILRNKNTIKRNNLKLNRKILVGGIEGAALIIYMYSIAKNSSEPILQENLQSLGLIVVGIDFLRRMFWLFSAEGSKFWNQGNIEVHFWNKLKFLGYEVPEKDQVEWLENYLENQAIKAAKRFPELKKVFKTAQQNFWKELQSPSCESELLGK